MELLHSVNSLLFLHVDIIQCNPFCRPSSRKGPVEDKENTVNTQSDNPKSEEAHRGKAEKCLTKISVNTSRKNGRRGGSEDEEEREKRRGMDERERKYIEEKTNGWRGEMYGREWRCICMSKYRDE
jgi:hypothetical protein